MFLFISSAQLLIYEAWYLCYETGVRNEKFIIDFYPLQQNPLHYQYTTPYVRSIVQRNVTAHHLSPFSIVPFFVFSFPKSDNFSPSLNFSLLETEDPGAPESGYSLKIALQAEH